MVVLLNAKPYTSNDSIDKHTGTGRPLGEASFVEKIGKKIGRTLKKKKPGPKGPWKHKK